MAKNVAIERHSILMSIINILFKIFDDILKIFNIFEISQSYSVSFTFRFRKYLTGSRAYYSWYLFTLKFIKSPIKLII